MRSAFTVVPAFGIIVSMSACGGDGRSPLAPETPGASPAPPAAVSLPAPLEITIGGQMTVDHPGESAQLVVTARYEGGTTLDVSNQVTWQADEHLRISSSGLVTALRYGQFSVSASLATRPHRSAQASFRVAPTGAFLLQGTLRTASGVPIMQTVVEAASNAGTLQATTDDYGWFIVAAMAETRLRVEKDGFRPISQRLTVDRDHNVDLELQRSDKGGLSGRYQLTLTASSACSLPAEAMQRTYDALLEQIDQNLVVLVFGGDFVTWGSEPGFTGRRLGEAVEFQLTDSLQEQYQLIERIPGVGDLHYAGMAAGTIGDGQIVATLSARLTIDRGWATCRADNHRLALVRTN